MSQSHLNSQFLQDLRSWISLLLLLLFSPLLLCAQSSKEVKTNQARLKAEIALTQNNLKKLQKDKTVNLARYNNLNHQLKSRNALIKNMEIELDFIEADLVTQEADIKLLKMRYDRQGARYKESVHDYHKVRTSYSPMAFIFSSSDLVTAWKRMTFYQRLSKYHKSQVIKLKEQEEDLLTNLNSLKLLQEEKLKSLEEVESQKSKISKDQKNKKAELDRLQKNEGFLLKRLKSQEAQSKKLAALMTRLVEASIKKKETADLPVATKRLNKVFGSNKGKLPWPVSKGYIGKKFGKQRHPELKMIFINNNGIDIITEEGSEVLSVFEGKVMAVQTVAGFNNTILINHGSYFTVYANVDNVAVSIGEQVKTGQTLAYVATSDNGSSIHFELWKGKVLQNPASWLRRR